MSEFILPTLVQDLASDFYAAKNIRVTLKRDDLIHPVVSGNKWRKLKYAIQYAVDKKLKGILTFGGAFSNHLHATAFACNQFNLECIAVIRGEYIDIDNPTLKDVKAQGATLVPVSRKEYAQRYESDYLNRLQTEYPNFLILEEGGRSPMALQGVGEIWDELSELPDHLLLPVGSAATIAGLIKNMPQHTHTVIHGICCVKDDRLKPYLDHFILPDHKVILYDQFTQGGFAKVNADLVSFINRFKRIHEVQLDPIYSGKMFMAFHELLDANVFQKGDTVMLLHTGGLQGIRGHNLRYADRPELLIEY